MKRFEHMPFTAKRLILSAAVAAVGLVVTRDAHAQEDYARRYAQGSVGLVQQMGLTAVPSSGTLVLGNGPAAGTFGIGAAVRITHRRFLIEPMIGFDFGATPVTGGTAITASDFRGGVGIGAALALTERFALSPMGEVVFYAPFAGNYGFDTLVAGELPFTIFIGRNGFIEPYVMLGTLIHAPPNNPANAYFALGGGYRLGVVF